MPLSVTSQRLAPTRFGLTRLPWCKRLQECGAREPAHAPAACHRGPGQRQPARLFEICAGSEHGGKGAGTSSCLATAWSMPSSRQQCRLCTSKAYAMSLAVLRQNRGASSASCTPDAHAHRHHRWQPQVDHVVEHLQMPLRLHVPSHNPKRRPQTAPAAHSELFASPHARSRSLGARRANLMAVAHNAPSILDRQPWDDSVVRPLSGSNHVVVALADAESIPAVLQREPAACWHYAGAKAHVVAVDHARTIACPSPDKSVTS